MIAVPGGAAEGKQWLTYVQRLIREYGQKLVIKEDKSAVYVFSKNRRDQTFSHILGQKGTNGLEYLGFRYDGRHVYIRNSTISGLWRKVTFAARRNSINFIQKHPTRSADELKEIFNYERLIKEFGKVEDFGEKQEDYRSWTFLTYAHRAAITFGPLGRNIPRQLRRHSSFVRERVRLEIEQAVERRDNAKVIRFLNSGDTAFILPEPVSTITFVD